MLFRSGVGSVHAQAVLGGPSLPYSQRVVAQNMATGAITTNNVLIADHGNKNGLSVQLNLLGLGAGATNSCTVLLQKSNDNSNWVNADTLLLTGTGATSATCISNVTASAVRYWRVRSVTSTANGTGTNLNVEVWVGRTE